VAGTVYGGIWTAQSTPSTRLNISPADNKVVLSWTIPSTNFALQESPDLISWSSITDVPTLNLTNLRNEITLPSTNRSGFYRLSTP
jgi:hypothetical protein